MSVPLRVFLVDDEPLALKRLARLLEATGRVEIVGRASDPSRAVAELADAVVDVVFLDIHMPGLSGLEVAGRLPQHLMVVFTTAHDQHAVTAFEINAVDYLLKPIERGRLNATLDRVAARRAEPPRDDLAATLEKLTGHLRGATHLGHLASRVGERVHLIPVDEVTHVFARERATYAATATAEHMLDTPLVDLERRLDPAKFVRIHRSTLLNLDHLDEVQPWPGGRLLVRVKDPKRTELEVARDRVQALKERLGL